jgi:hypothetical protein
MKVICIKTVINKPDKGISNMDMTDYLKVGTIFWVYGLEFQNNTFYIYIFDGNHLLPVPIELFEIIDNKVPDVWQVKIQNSAYGPVINLLPELFYQENFWENFTEYEQVERDKFQLLRKVIEQ